MKDTMKDRIKFSLMSLALGAAAMFAWCGFATGGFNTHPTERYIVEHHCSFLESYHTDGEIVIVDGAEVKAPSGSWDYWQCPNGQAVTVSQSPAQPSAEKAGQ